MNVHADCSGSYRVAMTGRSGYLGREIARRLSDRGHEVVDLRRVGQTTQEWKTRCADIDAVVHLAAPTSALDARAADEALAVTRRLMDALPARPIRVVLASSMALFEPPRGEAPVDEASSVHADLPGQDLYTRMKLMQEDAVRAACAANGWHLTILRPSNVWDRERWQQSCVGPKIGPLWLVIAPSRRLRLIHRTNCAVAFVDALARPVDADRSSPEEINLDDGSGISAWGFVTRTIVWYRHGYLPIPVPGRLFDALTATAAWIIRRVAPTRRLPGLLIAQRRVARFGAYRIDTRRAREQAGWHPDLAFYDPTGHS